MRRPLLVVIAVGVAGWSATARGEAPSVTPSVTPGSPLSAGRPPDAQARARVGLYAVAAVGAGVATDGSTAVLVHTSMGARIRWPSETWLEVGMTADSIRTDVAGIDYFLPLGLEARLDRPWPGTRWRVGARASIAWGIRPRDDDRELVIVGLQASRDPWFLRAEAMLSVGDTSPSMVTLGAGFQSKLAIAPFLVMLGTIVVFSVADGISS